MKSWNKAGKVRLALAAALWISVGASQAWGAAQNTKGEGKCQTAITKSLGKHAAAVAKAMAACENAVLAAGMGTCPDATAQAAIDKSAAKSAKSVNKKCQSSCSASAVPCIGTPQCPPNGILTENCTAAGKNFFEMTAMGFPGAYCETIINDKMRDPEDFGACSNGVAEIISDELIDNIYGDLVAAPGEAAQDCLDAIAKALPKSASKLASTVAKCRNTQLTASSAVILPDNCPTGDPKVADAITKTHAKLDDKIAGACDDAAISALSLCGNGIGGTLTVAAAQACLRDVLDQASFSTDNAENRPFAGISIINGAYPETAKARCGDNLINQQANQFLLNGEECDGTDLGDCASCLPPGDTFECTCAETRRSRAFANGAGSDLDIGWSGSSQNSKVTDRAGFVAEITPGSCDCTEFTDATCTGSSVDPVCTVSAVLNPRCSNRIGDGTTCDQVGDNNGANTRQDCRVCGEGAANEGDYCTGSARRCVGGVNPGQRCNQASDCTGGSCSGSGVCVGGASDGDGCTANANCPGGICAVNECEGGVDDGEPCSGNADCAGAPTTSRCAQTSDCASQCIDAMGTPVDNCWSQADCPEGTRCSGACDKSNTCVIIRNGAPLPLSSEGTSVCLDSQFFSNVTGTKNIVTGEHEINYELRSITILSNEINSSPCPVCGGWCEITGSQLDQFRCSGNCTGPALECRFGPNIGDTCVTNADCSDALCTAVACRFDDDCNGNGTCSGTASPDCQGGNCRLDLACNLGPNEGLPCRIEASTAFGTTSADCPPDPATNVSGAGLAISWTPLTSGTITAEAPGACDANGYQNYDCNCVTGGGSTRTQPNRCEAACNAGPNYGASCAGFTTCVSGSEAGAACDEDSDCSGGGTCTGNPRVCGTGNEGACSVKSCVLGVKAGEPCANNIQCPGGTCPDVACTIGGAPCTYGVCKPDSCLSDANCEMGVTCDDVCPTGLCTPLCVPHGLCNGGPRNGQQCALDPDCLGGTCIPDDPEEGACAQGTFEHCDGPGWEFVGCAPLQVGTKQGCEFGTDNVGGNANDNVGAGYCVSDVTQCFINNGNAEGGSTLNGKGDPTNTYSVAAYCIPASTSSSVNATAGMPGPGRIRQNAVSVINFTSLP